MNHRTALVTGVGRARGIGATIAVRLAEGGWDLTLGHWPEYDARLGLEGQPSDPQQIAERCRALGARVELVAADLADPDVPAQLVAAANARGDLTAVVMSHCESVGTGILDTTLESWERHYAVNARAAWLLIKAFAEHVSPEVVEAQVARVVALTSDDTVENLPYGSSKAALDRIVCSSARELAHLNIRANVINPGPIDTGWMSDQSREVLTTLTPARRLGTPQDTADLVEFLLGPRGGWINGQLLHSNGGFQ